MTVAGEDGEILYFYDILMKRPEIRTNRKGDGKNKKVIESELNGCVCVIFTHV